MASERRHSTIDTLLEALGLRPQQRAQRRETRRAVGLGISAATHDAEHHLLYSGHFGPEATAVIVVTGIPEGPGELSRSEGYDLAPLFARADDQTAVLQVYIGSNPLDILAVAHRLPRYFQRALELAVQAKEIHIAAVSAGVFGLAAFQDLPAEAAESITAKVRSLALASPFLGSDYISSTALRCFARLLGFPGTPRSLETIGNLADDLLERAGVVRVILGEADQLIDSEAAAEAFARRFPGAHVEVRARRHGPPPEEVWPPDLG